MILIAGGDGFIGKHVAAALDNLDPNLYEIADLKRGLDVCAVDGNVEKVKPAEIIEYVI